MVAAYNSLGTPLRQLETMSLILGRWVLGRLLLDQMMIREHFARVAEANFPLLS